MLHAMNCIARVNAQDPTYPTYKALDCIAHVNANDEGIYGRIMDMEATITNLIVAACQNWDQGIRLAVTIDGVNVSASLIDSLSIQHDKNAISTFSLYLGDTQYSPRTNSHIDLDKEVVIIAYINGQEKKLLTGTIDEPSADNTPDFRVSITGRDYGKKLLDKKTTVVSVQDLADSTKRNDLIKYLAGLASITAIDIPGMDAVTIDNSFTYQSIWDMIQKEAMVELYWIKFDEDGNLKLLLDEIKSDEDLYPTPDWTYDEDRIIRLGYKKGRIEINKITILGQTNQSSLNTAEYHCDDYEATFSNSWGAGDATVWSESQSIYRLEYVINRTTSDYEWGDIYIYIDPGLTDRWTWTSWYHADSHTGGVHSYAWLKNQGYFSALIDNYYLFRIKRHKTAGVLDAGTLDIFISSGVIYYTNSSEIQYNQISAEVTDPNSIAKYGERDGGSVEYPLLETVEQCQAVGSKVIRDSHRLLGQTDLSIPFNPLIQTGQTIAINDNKIGITERYYIETIEHNINFGDGKVNAETIIGGVLYV